MNTAVRSRSGVSSFFNGLLISLGIVAVALAFAPVHSSIAGVQEEALAHLDKIRAIKTDVDSKVLERNNQQMDEAWKFFERNKASVLPVLRDQLALEIGKPRRSELLLLDIGSFLYINNTEKDGTANKAVAKRALYSLDTKSEIIQWNQDQLFKFSHAVAADHDPQILGFIDKVFLRGKVGTFIPQHSLKLDETLVCVYLYGVYGPDAEAHLRPLLREPAVTKKVIEILVWLGSPQSVDAVQATLSANRDYETFGRVTTFMMQAGGPKGRAAMLAVNPQQLDSKSRDYYQGIKPRIEEVSFDMLSRQFDSFATESISDAELKKRLVAMYDNYGRDEKTSPKSLIGSKLPADFLINELTRIRGRTFNRVSDEALSDVQMSNALINALRYRQK